ncbi:MAG: hypothetical protein WCT26_01925 [Candidatus Buchananbacteria bacterium]|jgi:hypothetical protein
MEGDEQMNGGTNYQLESNEAGKYLNPATSSRPHREKFNSILILSIGFFAVVIGGVSMWLNLANPFESIIKQGMEQDKLLAAAQQAELLAIQAKDTDGDGLSDYDETNKYNSSPYLKDSDGDNIDDKTEVARGTDPNCPEGQNCFAGNSGSNASSSDSVPQLQTSISQPSIDITPAYIRQIMKSNGATDAQLTALTDEELMTEFNNYLEANPALVAELTAKGVNVNIGAAQSTASAVLAQPDTGNVDLKALNVTSVADLQKLTGPQIRQLMVNAGASAAVLAQVTDDQLKTMFLAQLENNNKNATNQ